MNLKPCPFCGSDDLHSNNIDRFDPKWVIFCESCSTIGPEESTKPAAEMSWNNREDSE